MDQSLNTLIFEFEDDVEECSIREIYKLSNCSENIGRKHLESIVDKKKSKRFDNSKRWRNNIGFNHHSGRKYFNNNSDVYDSFGNNNYYDGPSNSSNNIRSNELSLFRGSRKFQNPSCLKRYNNNNNNNNNNEEFIEEEDRLMNSEFEEKFGKKVISSEEETSNSSNSSSSSSSSASSASSTSDSELECSVKSETRGRTVDSRNNINLQKNNRRDRKYLSDDSNSTRNFRNRNALSGNREKILEEMRKEFMEIMSFCPTQLPEDDIESESKSKKSTKEVSRFKASKISRNASIKNRERSRLLGGPGQEFPNHRRRRNENENQNGADDNSRNRFCGINFVGGKMVNVGNMDDKNRNMTKEEMEKADEEELIWEAWRVKHFKRHCLDLHGLRIKDAKFQVGKYIDWCREGNVKSTNIIVGKGKHSSNKISQMAPAIYNYLSHCLGVCVKENLSNNGILVVKL